MIKVTREPEEYDSTTLEDCVFCKQQTRYWARDGDIPVCRNCATKREESELPTREDWITT